jgi:hypothetical protein
MELSLIYRSASGLRAPSSFGPVRVQKNENPPQLSDGLTIAPVFGTDPINLGQELLGLVL